MSRSDVLNARIADLESKVRKWKIRAETAITAGDARIAELEEESMLALEQGAYTCRVYLKRAEQAEAERDKLREALQAQVDAWNSADQPGSLWDRVDAAIEQAQAALAPSVEGDEG